MKPTAIELMSYAMKLNTVEAIIKLKKKFLLNTTNISEFESAIQLSRDVPSEAYKVANAKLLNEMGEHFIAIGDNLERWNFLRSKFNLPKEDLANWNRMKSRVQLIKREKFSCTVFYAS